MNNLEDFYVQRFQLYKYVVYHHRVVKFDGLLQKCIEELAQRALSTGSDGGAGKDAADQLELNPDISGLWQPFPKPVRARLGQLQSFYVQWDDAWLLSVLRREYFRLKSGRELAGGHLKAPTVLELRLEELLSNRKHYHALYKRAECFLTVDLEFVIEAGKANLPPKWWEKLVAQVSPGDQLPTALRAASNIGDHVTHLLGLIEEDPTGIESNPRITELVEREGYVLARVCKLFWALNGQNTPLRFVKAASLSLQGARCADIHDVVDIQKNIKSGVKKEFTLANNDGQAIALGRVSRVADELERAALLFPPFFVFLLLKDERAEKDMNEWRKEFGKHVWNAFYAWMNMLDKTI